MCLVQRLANSRSIIWNNFGLKLDDNRYIITSYTLASEIVAFWVVIALLIIIAKAELEVSFKQITKEPYPVVGYMYGMRQKTRQYHYHLQTTQWKTDDVCVYRIILCVYIVTKSNYADSCSCWIKSFIHQKWL